MAEVIIFIFMPLFVAAFLFALFLYVGILAINFFRSFGELGHESERFISDDL